MAMNRRDIYALFRELVGNKTEVQCSARAIDTFVNDAADELASELDYVVKTDTTTLALTADTYEYVLPSHVNEIHWAKWNNRELDKTSTEEWVRYGVEWRSATSAEPREIAVKANKVLIYPPPSSTAITTDGFITYEYSASSIAMDEDGIPQMRDSDVRIAVRVGAMNWCLAHPEDPANSQRAANLAAVINRRMGSAVDRSQQPIRDYAPVITPPTSRGAAR